MHQQIGKMNKSANSVILTVTLLLIQASLILGQNGEKSVDLVMPGRTHDGQQKWKPVECFACQQNYQENLFTFVFISELYSNVKKVTKKNLWNYWIHWIFLGKLQCATAISRVFIFIDLLMKSIWNSYSWKNKLPS